MENIGKWGLLIAVYMKKILVFLHTFEVGGVTRVLKGLYRDLDRTKFSMDFIRLNKEINDFDEEIISTDESEENEDFEEMKAKVKAFDQDALLLITEIIGDTLIISEEDI